MADSAIEFLREIPLFHEVGKRDLERLAEAGHERTFEPGTLIVPKDVWHGLRGGPMGVENVDREVAALAGQPPSPWRPRPSSAAAAAPDPGRKRIGLSWPGARGPHGPVQAEIGDELLQPPVLVLELA